MLLKSSTPVFPVELFDYTINHLGEREFDQPFDFGQLNALKACALVCKRFSELCRVHIFGYVAFSDLAWSARGQRRRLLRFVRALEKNSSLKNHVRELSLDDLMHVWLTDRQFPRCEAVLLSFPHLQCLTVNQAVMEPPPDELLAQWMTIGCRLVDTYIGCGTLRSIQVQGFEELPLENMLGFCPLLRTVKIGQFELPEHALPTAYTITSFHICDVAEFPLSVLCSLPMLKNLELLNVDQIIPGKQDSRTISFTITELRVQDVGSLSELFNFFYSQAIAKQTHAFDRLKILEFHAKVESDSQQLCALLEQTSSLQTLIIDGSEYFDHSFPLVELNLAERIRKTFTSLKKLVLDIKAFPYPDGYITSVNNILALLTSVANNNILQSLTFVLTTDLASRDLPSPAPLHPLSSLLASPSAFPCLNEVEVCLFLSATSTDITKEFEGRDKELDQYVFTAMSELGHRLGMDLRGSVSVEVLEDLYHV